MLHFHLSEECFRVESTTYPQLTASCVDGAGNNTAFYTHADIADIVQCTALDARVTRRPPRISTSPASPRMHDSPLAR